MALFDCAIAQSWGAIVLILQADDGHIAVAAATEFCRFSSATDAD
jgi:hypothetical protein